MTTTQNTTITKILTEEIGDVLGNYEIRNAIAVMDKTSFGNDGTVDAEKLKKACYDAMYYLESVTRPVNMMAMDAIYKNKIFIAIAKIQNAIK